MGSGYRRFIGGRSAGDAGAMAQNNGKTSTVRNCTFTGNEAQFGFVAALEQNAIANTRVLGCTFTRNRGECRGLVPVWLHCILFTFQHCLCLFAGKQECYNPGSLEAAGCRAAGLLFWSTMSVNTGGIDGGDEGVCLCCRAEQWGAGAPGLRHGAHPGHHFRIQHRYCSPVKS
jgi:hypothetical protein